MSMKLNNRQWAIVVLTAVTALIHLALGIVSEGMFLVLFVLNGLGYLALVAALYFLPQVARQRPLVRYALLGFTAGTVVMYFVFNGTAGLTQPVGMLTKVIEVVLLVLLWQEPV